MPKLARIASEIPVPDLEEAIAYYSTKLGFALEMMMPDRSYAVLERDDVALHLFHDRSATHFPLPCMY